MQKSVQPLPKSIKRTAILLTLGISLHNFPEGIATFVTASSNWAGIWHRTGRRVAQYP